MHSTKTIKTAKFGYVVMSLLLCTLGITLIAFPKLSLSAIIRITGVVMCVYGAVKIVGYFSRDLYRLAFQFDLAYGLLIIVLGIVMLLFTDNLVSGFGFMLGVIVLTDALFKVQITLDSKKFGIGSWWLIALFALLTAAVGILLIANPHIMAELTMMLAGISLVCEGVLNLCVVILAVKIVKNQIPDTNA